MNGNSVFAGQMDYVHLVYGMGFVLVAVTGWGLIHARDRRLPWNWLAMFGLTHGIVKWLDMAVFALPDLPAFTVGRALLNILSYMFLLEFARLGVAAVSLRTPSRWIFAVCAGVAALGGLESFEGLDAAARWAIAVVGALGAAWVFYRYQRVRRRRTRSLGVLAACFALYAVLAVFGPKAGFFPASVINAETFQRVAGFPVQMARGLLAFVMAAALLHYCDALRRDLLRDLGLRPGLRWMAVFSVALGGILCGGWIMAERQGRVADSDQRQKMLTIVQISASSLDASDVRRLTATRADLHSPHYLAVRKQLVRMQAMAEAAALRWYYLMALHGKDVLFTVDPTEEGWEDWTPPGTPYPDAPPAVFEVFRTGAAATAGPYTDDWGEFISALAPVVDAETDRVVGVLGLDLDAADWRRVVARDRLAWILITLLVSGLLVAFVVMMWRQEESNAILRATEETTRAFFNASTDPALLVDRDGRILLHNQVAALRYGRENLVGMEASEGVVPEVAEARRERFQEVLRTGQPVRFDSFNRGRWLDISFYPVLSAQGRVERVAVYTRDITEQKEAEKALQASECRFRELADLLPQTVFECDLAGRITFANRHAFERFGYTPEDLARGVTLFDTAAPSDRDLVWDEVQRVFRDQTFSSREYTAMRKDGVFFPVVVYMSAVVRDGRVCGGRGIAADITDLKRAEAALRESEARLRAAFSNLPFDFWASDAEGRYALQSPASTALWGNLIGKRGREVAPDAETLAIWEENNRRALAGEVVRSERKYTVRGEVRHFYEIIAPILQEGVVRGLLGINIDITDRKRAEEALRQSERRYHDLFEGASDAIIIMKDGVAVDCNARAPRLFACTREELIGSSAPQWWSQVQKDPKALETQGADFIRAALEGHPQNFEWRHRRADGVEFDTEVFLSRVDIGGVPHLQAILRDITERKRAAEERARLSEQLRQAQKMETIGRLAGGVAHDFNNLLTGISGNIELALMGLSSDDPRHTALAEAARAAASAAALTRQLLAFSRKQIIEPRIVDLNEMIRTMQKMLKRLIGEDLELRTAPQEGLGRIRADTGQLEQIIVNLVVNARDAMPGGGRVTLATSHATLDAADCARHTGARPGEYVVLEVADTGCGMGPDVMKHLFEPFFTTKPRGKGTGLGLATVYGAVTQHNGFVTVDSAPGRGTTFRIYFPRAADAPAPVAKLSGDALPRGSETILLAEDETVVRTFAEKVLQMLGYRVIACSSGPDALRAVETFTETIHLLVSDVIMPGMNGHALASELTRRLPNLKVLFMSGYTEDVIVHHGVLEEGINFLAKPFTPQALARRVREVLDRP